MFVKKSTRTDVTSLSSEIDQAQRRDGSDAQPEAEKTKY